MLACRIRISDEGSKAESESRTAGTSCNSGCRHMKTQILRCMYQLVPADTYLILNGFVLPGYTARKVLLSSFAKQWLEAHVQGEPDAMRMELGTESRDWGKQAS